VTADRAAQQTCLRDIRASDIAAQNNNQKAADAANQKVSFDCEKADVLLGPPPSSA
jgi:hypothetical protein